MATPTSRVFDHNNRNFTYPLEYNIVFLKAIQQYLNDTLNTRGHVFLNDVYDALNVDRTQAGARLGWFKDTTDVRINFGPMIPNEDGSIQLEFNTQGEIATRLPEF